MSRFTDRRPITPELQALLEEWTQWMEAQSLSQRTIHNRWDVVTLLINYTGADPLALTPGDIIRFVGRPGVSRNTRSTYHATIRAYCKWLQKTKRRTDNPADETPTPKKPAGLPRPISQLQLQQVLNVANRRRTRMMILLAALAGLRVHEIAKLRGEDVDRVAGALRVEGKGGKLAELPLHARILDEAQRSRFPDTGFWFPDFAKQRHANAGHISNQGVSKAISGAMSRAGVPGTPHALRHFYATALLDGGTDLRVVQELMRHSSVATTAIYTQVSDVKRRSAIGRLFQDEAS